MNSGISWNKKIKSDVVSFDMSALLYRCSLRAGAPARTWPGEKFPAEIVIASNCEKIFI